MTRDEAAAILDLPREQAIEAILRLAEKAEASNPTAPQPAPTTPSSMIAPYRKPAHRQRKKTPGRPIGHPGTGRRRPTKLEKKNPVEAVLAAAKQAIMGDNNAEAEFELAA
jgi:hypothetical protein